jgi:hypothetical protein
MNTNFTYLNPNKLIKDRYDIIIKFLYIKALEENDNVALFRDIYREHLRVWNGFYEHNPRKTSFEDYEKSFIQIMMDIKGGKFNWTNSPIPINNDNYPLNGAHRIAVSLLYGVDVCCYNKNIKLEKWDRNFFIKRGLKPEYIKIIDEEIIKNSITYGDR